jgi:hypothetical protein
MGLLDDAIREHMELKRLRGADPSEVARQEHDALGPVVRERDGEEAVAAEGQGENEEPAAEDRDGAHEQLGPEHAARGEDEPSAGPPHPARSPDFANVGQETAELDMRTVLEEQHEQAEGVDSAQDGDSASYDDPVGSAGAHGDEGEPVEDVLEETPDFLRDTPEQERLWFEQQPPRDFDFDK